jgi:hypothetical protein
MRNPRSSIKANFFFFFIFFSSYLLSGIFSLPPFMAQEVFPNKNPEITRASILIGYGLVNNWFRIDPHRLGRLLSQNDLTLTEIEYVPWVDEEGGKGLSTQTYPEEAVRFVNAMRTYSITTLVSVVNWNSEAVRRASDEWFLGLVRKIRERIGTDLVLLLPVSEPDQSDKARRWQEAARCEWPGKLVLNSQGGRGRPLLSEKVDYLDWHWCSDFDASSVKTQIDGLEVINNTDCTPVINPGPERAGQMARAAVLKKAHFLVYDFDGTGIDEAVIRAVGEAVRRGGL